MTFGSLPEPDAGTILILAALGAKRRHKGVHWCRKNGIGAMRLSLRKMKPVARKVVVAAPSGAHSLEQAMSEASCVLAATCRVCGQCDMARR